MNTNSDWYEDFPIDKKSEEDWWLTTERPWGCFTVLDRSDRVWVKRIEVDPLKRLSMQRHQRRKEIWLCVSGDGLAHVGGLDLRMIEGTTVRIERGQWHRLTAGQDGITIIELAHGVPDEDDIERSHDDYGRC